MPLPEITQSLDGWPAITAAIFAGAAALLVPLNGFIKTLLDYRLEARKGEALKPETARDIAQSTGSNALFDTMSVSDLTAALKDLTAAIRADTQSDEAHHSSQLAAAINKFTERMDRFDEHEAPVRRGHR